MIVMSIAMDSIPKKRAETEKAIQSMTSDVRNEPGCRQANVYSDLDEKDRFLLVLHWDRREDLDAYLQSDKFSALMGARILMKNSPLVSVDTVATRNGMEAISEARARANTH